MASTSLSRTMGTSTSELKHTCSMWLKRSGLGTEQFVWMNREDGSNRTYLDLIPQILLLLKMKVVLR